MSTNDDKKSSSQQAEEDARAKNRARKSRAPQSAKPASSSSTAAAAAVSQIDRDVAAKNRARAGGGPRATKPGAATAAATAATSARTVDSRLEQDVAAKRAARAGRSSGPSTATAVPQSRPGAVATTGGSRTGKVSRRTAEESAAARQHAQDQMDDTNKHVALGMVEEDVMIKARMKKEHQKMKSAGISSTPGTGVVVKSASSASNSDNNDLYGDIQTESSTLSREDYAGNDKDNMVEDAEENKKRSSSASSASDYDNGGGYEDRMGTSMEPPDFQDEPPAGDEAEYAGLRQSVMADSELVTAADVHGGERGGGIEAFVAEPEVVEAGGVALLPTDDELEAMERQKMRKYMVYGTLCFILLAVVIIVPLVVVLGGDKDPGTTMPSTSPSLQPSSSPSSSPTSIGLSEILQFLIDNDISKAEDLNQVGSPQYRAAEWMADVDELNLDYNIFGNGQQQWFQRYRLVTMYYATNGDDWLICGKNSVSCADRYGDWLVPNESECEWFGVGCNAAGTVTSFTTVGDRQSEGNKLNGTIPEEFYDLTSLASIAIHGNQLQGTISASLAKLSDLTTLNLHSNRFTGTFPSDEFFGVSTKLTLLFALFNNPKLVGTIPSSIGKSTTLQRFQVANTGFRGELPEEFYEMTSLKRLDLRYCKFEGGISSKFDQFTQLSTALLSNNTFAGNFPPLTNTASLKTLALEGNNFEGTLPTAFCQLGGLDDLFVDCDDLECPSSCTAKCSCKLHSDD